MQTIIVTPKNKKAIPFLKHLLSTLEDVDKVEVVNLPQNKTEKSIEAGLNLLFNPFQVGWLFSAFP